MAPVAVTVENTNKTSYDVKDAMNVLFGKLDEAIDDMENGRTLSSEEMWKEIDEI
ncbi:MAG: hypothetical protein PHE09_14805 [Oscillospiraceae bacterium]|nr:hypothetical protein [Oscillospiraceae bacterium]